MGDRSGGRMIVKSCWLTFVVIALCSALPQVSAAQRGAREESETAAPRTGPGFMTRFGRGLLLEQIRAGSAQERVAAARELGRRQDRNAVPHLIALLEGAQIAPAGSSNVAIIEALGEIGDRRAVPVLLAMLESRGPLQRAAIRSLGQIGDERALDPIANLLSRPSVTRDAIEALLQLGPRVLMRTVSLLRDPSTSGAACELLGRLGDRRAMWHMVRALDSPRARVRRQCAVALGELGDPRAQRALFQLMQDPDAAVRRRALEAIVAVADGSMGPVLTPLLSEQELAAQVVPALRGASAKAAIPALAELARGEPGPQQEEAVVALGRIGGEESVAVLAKLLKGSRGEVRFQAASSLAKVEPTLAHPVLMASATDDSESRAEALRGLGDLYRPVELFRSVRRPPREVFDVAREALSEPSPELVGAGVFLAGAIRDEETIPVLAKLSERPALPELRALALTALGWMATEEACAPVIRGMSDVHEGVRAMAAWSAGELRCSDAESALLVMLERGPDTAAANAAWALGEVGTEAATELLRQHLDVGGPALRANAALALAALGDQRASVVIRRRVERESSPNVKAALVQALAHLGGERNALLLERLTATPGMSGLFARRGVAAIRGGRRFIPPSGSSVIRLRFTDHIGEPRRNIWASLVLPDGRFYGGITDTNGEITVVGVPQGRPVMSIGGQR